MVDTLEVMVARIDERTKAQDEKLDNHMTRVTKLLVDHEKRIRGMEHHLSYVLGAGAGAGSVAGLTAAVILRFLGG